LLSQSRSWLQLSASRQLRISRNFGNYASGRLYERLYELPAPALGRSIDDFALYEALLAGCAYRVAHGYSLVSTVPSPDEGTLKAVAELRAKTSLSADERAFLEYFDLMEEIRLALGGR
jgi:hypothetical protein